MTDSYSKVLLGCVLASCAGLMVLSALPVPAYLPIFGGLGPLAYYHLVYLTPRAKRGVGQSAIDSVYYYGFLVTIVALGVSAIHLAVNGITEDFTPIAFQFGLGLLATGYAVAARMHLLAISQPLDDASPEEIFDRYVQRSRELVTNIELASASFTSYAQTLADQATAFAKRSQKDAQETIKLAAEAFRDEIAATVAEGRQGLADLRAVVNDTTFGAERVEMRKQVRAIVESMAALNGAVESMTKSTSVGSSAVKDMALAVGSVKDNAGGAAAQLDRLADPQGGISRFVDAVGVGTSKIEGASTAMGRASEQFDAVAQHVRATAAALADMEGLATATRDQTAALVKMTEATSIAAASAEEANASLKTMNESSRASATALASLTSGLGGLQPVFDLIAGSGERAKPHLKALFEEVERLNRLATELAPVSAGLTKLASSLASNGEAISNGAAGTKAAIEDLRVFAEQASASRTAAAGFEEAVLQLQTTLGHLNVALIDSTGGLKDSMATASAQLDDTLVISTRSVEKLTVDLGRMADFIVERTSREQRQDAPVG